MDELFALLFKYRPFYFLNGEFALQSPLSVLQWILLAAGAFTVLFFVYRRRFLTGGLSRRGWALLAMRTALLLLIALLLCRPSLVLTSTVPKENLLALLVDNSKSMGIEERSQGAPRGQGVADLLDEDSEFLSALDEKFYLRTYVFDSKARRMSEDEGLQADWQGDQTNIKSGIDAVLAETRNLPLGGVVLFTDGADTSSGEFAETLAELKARKIPVHTVGVGPENLDKDVEIVQVSAPRTLLPETVSTARVTLRQRGFGGSRGRLEVREGTSLIEAKEVSFPRNAETFNVEVSLVPREEGARLYEFTLQRLNGEQIAENNRRSALIDVRNRQPRILYVEGHPRWEFKFIRQALADDQYIRLETLLRTALNKLYRQGIEEETTLATGFPTEREELFEYEAIIFGSVESSFFSVPQMELVRDFVAQRGGGFLMLGGSKSFQSGGYRNQPIEEVLPVWLQDETRRGSPSTYYLQDDFFPTLSQFGMSHAALQLSPSPEENVRRWEALPELKDSNIVQSLKAGAVTLASVGAAGTRGQRPLLAFQRFGRGQSAALMTGSTWRWQMLQEHEDQSHETFWRQMMRWMVSTAKGPVAVEMDREVYSADEPARIRAEVRDKAFHAINDARVEAVVTAPSGETASFALQWDSREDGIYRSEWTPQEDGLHRVEISAASRGATEEAVEDYGSARAQFMVAGGAREYFDPVRKTDFLRKLAQQTGGSYYSLDQAERLPEEVVYTPSTASVVEVLDLWDMPIFFLLALALAGGEWILRKRQGLI